MSEMMDGAADVASALTLCTTPPRRMSNPKPRCQQHIRCYRHERVATPVERRNHRGNHSLEPAAAAGGATCVGGGVGVSRFGAAGFFAATGAAGGADDVGLGDSNDALAPDDAGAAGAGGGTARGADGGDAEPGSGVMMLTAGVEAAVGNSAFVGRPVGTDDDSIATGAEIAGALHDAAYFVTIAS